MRSFAIALSLVLVVPAAVAGALDDNRALARTIFTEVLMRGDFELAKRLYAPDFVNHGRTRDASLAEDHAAARGWLEAFPDLLIRPQIVLAEGDLVAVVWQARGTNSGAGNGIPATGRSIEGRGITLWRIAAGRVQEEWSEFSQLALLQQLGLAPGGTPIDPAKLPPLEAEHPAGSVSRAERERNRALVTSVFEEILGEGKTALFDTSYSKDFVNHGIRGTNGIQSEIEGTVGFRKLAPDLKVTVTRTVADGHFVAVVLTAEGTNTGEAVGYPAGGKAFRIRGMSVMRVAGGRICEEWSVLDQSQAFEPPGLLPAQSRTE